MFLVTAACSGKKDRAEPPAVSQPVGLDVAPTPVSAVATTVIPVEAPPEAPPPAATFRTDCNAIRGNDYLSGEERSWFLANCGGGASASAGSGGAPGVQAPTGDRLIIGAAGVNTEVWRTLVPTSGRIPDPLGYFNAVSYDFSRLPGFGGDVNSGNLVMSGHVDCARCHNGGSGTAVFWSVRNLKPGDTAQYRRADGTTVNYVVTSSRSLSPTADWDSIVAQGAADMTLITCTGTFSGGEYSLRHVVALKKA